MSIDTKRLDWLERQCVQVRTPMRYGSQHRFWASPGIEDDEQRSDLRERIDLALAASGSQEQSASGSTKP